jgi:hypothetical protein
MRTERQIEASRTNGSKSRGPVTEEGKRASSLNATKHALLSGTVVLKCESEDRFHELHTALIEEFQPETRFEESLVESMAVARWRQMRVWGMEKANMEQAMRKHAESCHPDDDSAIHAALAFRALSTDNRSLDLILRYEALYERQYFRAHRRLMEVQGRRTPPSAPTPTPQLAPVIPFPEPEPEAEPAPAPATPGPQLISAKRTQQTIENNAGGQLTSAAEPQISLALIVVPDTDSDPGGRLYGDPY